MLFMAYTFSQLANTEEADKEAFNQLESVHHLIIESFFDNHKTTDVVSIEK